MESIGNRLRAAREGQGLSVEDAAHETRIQAIYIRGLENDDFSNFPSTTYAKSFLTLYSRFLEVDATDALEQFTGGDAISLSGQGYLEAVTDEIQPRRPSSAYAYRPSRPSAAPRRRQRSVARENSPGMAPLFLGLILVALVVAIPTLWLLGKDAESIDEVVTKAEDLKTQLTPSGSDAEKESEPETTEKQGPPSPSPSKPRTEPVSSPGSPSETKMAQVTPPSTTRTLENSPVPVITGEKPKPADPATSIQAKPISATPVKPVPEEPETNTGPASSDQPLRAVPLIARPVIEPEEGAETGPEEAGEEAPESDPRPRADGNLFPRPLE